MFYSESSLFKISTPLTLMETVIETHLIFGDTYTHPPKIAAPLVDTTRTNMYRQPRAVRIHRIRLVNASIINDISIASRKLAPAPLTNAVLRHTNIILKTPRFPYYKT